MGRKARSKAERREPTASRPADRAVAGVEPSRRDPIVRRVIAGAALLLVLALIWAAPRPAVDTFMGLAGGRDVFEGKLGKPDDWSFTTAGRVWLNQNWGFDALMYAAFKAGGEGGLLALKALTLLAIAGAAVAAAHRRGAGWTSALLVVAAAMAGARWYFELRANLATFLMACLLLLVVYESARRPRLIWLAVPLIAVWSDLHGGYTLGLMLLALWIAAGGVGAFLRGGVRAALRLAWAPVAAAAASVVAVAVLSPLGLANLTHPFTVLASPEWRKVREWLPSSFSTLRDPSMLWALTALVGVVALVAIWRIVRARGKGRVGEGSGTPLALVLFDAGLVVLMTSMAISARRFIPIALIALAPIAATQVGSVFGAVRSPIPAAAAALGLAAVLVPFAGRIAARYSGDNPRYTSESLFQRMTSADTTPAAAAEFLADNGVDGRAFAEWSWEGMLRWRHPGLKLFIGGRAQQVYSVETLHGYDAIQASLRPDDVLAQREIHLVVVPFEDRWVELVEKLALARAAQWTAVYYDGRAVVLADVRAPETRALVGAVAGGTARFRDGRIASLSGALCRISPSMGGLDSQKVADVLAANRSFPTIGAPWALALVARGQRLRPEPLIRALEAEDAYLAGRSATPALSLASLKSRTNVDQVIAALYQSAGQGAQAGRWGAVSGELRSEVEAVLSRT